MSLKKSLIAKSENMPDNTKGLLWAILAAALFAVAAAMAKVVINEFHVLQILFFRQIVVFLSSLPSIANSFPQSLKTRHLGIHAFRLIGAFVALSCSIWAVTVLPLTTAITLGFAKVFFIALIAYYFLNESVSKQKFFAIVFGFVGVVIVIRPGVEGIFNINALIPIIGAVGAAVAATSVRKLSQSESTATLLIYQSLFVGALAGIPMLWLWVTPSLKDTVFLLSMGMVATAANWIGVKALRLGEASVVGNVEYTQLVWAAALGFVLFSEIPDIYTISGAAFIVSSSIYMLHHQTSHSTKKN